MEYYTSIFSKAQALDLFIVEHISGQVSQEQNRALCMVVTKEEVRMTIFSIHPGKAPGADSFNLSFYQNFWPIVGDDVYACVLKTLDDCLSPDDLHETRIILIPKSKNPKVLKGFRPIALSNVSYRIISKMLANRLKGVLGDLVSETQSAFILGWLITDNVLIV